MTKLDDFINTGTVFVDFHRPMQDCVQKMIERRVSSILVTDDNERVVGIVTERDIVRKFTLLDVADKLERKVGSFMTRPVRFVRCDHLLEDVMEMQKSLKVRHFPILVNDEATVENIVGMLSVSDILRFYLQKKEDEAPRAKPKSTPDLPLVIFSDSRAVREQYASVFKQLHYQVTAIDDLAKFLVDDKTHPPLIFDLDSFQLTKMKSMTPVALRYPGKLILTTHNPQMLTTFQKFIKPDRQIAAIKPLDFTYINWVLRERWAK